MPGHDDLHALLQSLIAGWENECVEFKQASGNSLSPHDIGKYFSGLANEANLRDRPAGWLVLGVADKTRQVCGTSFRDQPGGLNDLKRHIGQGTNPPTTFRDIHELDVAGHRVLLLEIPPAPRGMPIGWQGHYYGRQGESLVALGVAQQDRLRTQDAERDWSAVICENATLADLDPAAMAKAREVYAAHRQDTLVPGEVARLSDAEFLKHARLSLDGRLPRATLLLLGTPESARHLSPHPAEITWRLTGEETAYVHFQPPFLLETSRLYRRLRNLPLTLLPPGQLIPVEIRKYEERMVLEALHNCLAHQDYRRGERVVVTERATGLTFENGGSFFDGTPESHVLDDRTPRRYRNPFLARAMFTLRMMDRMGFGLRDILYAGQRRRYMSLPRYDLSDPDAVVMTLAGRFIDENYSRALFARPDLSWPEVMALDAIQHRQPADPAVVATLRRKKLVEGRRGQWHVTRQLAVATDTVESYLHHRAFDDKYYRDMILEYLRTRETARLADFQRLLDGKMSDLLSPAQRRSKLRWLLTTLRQTGAIATTGQTRGASWRLAATGDEPAKIRSRQPKDS